MLNGIGFIVILGCVFGSFLLSGGKLAVVLEALPHELMAIMGAAIGSFIVANSLGTIKKAMGGLLRAFKGERWKSSDYRDLLTMMFGLLTTFKKGGATGIEPHLDTPSESKLFSPYPRLLKDHHLIEFICDYLRMMTVNFEDPNQLESAMDADIDKHHHEELAPQHALQIMTDGLPAIGIVAAVLGVIKTMGSIDQPVEVLGAMIGGALVGTFLGVFLAYCIVQPISGRLTEIEDEDGAFYAVIRDIFVAMVASHPPNICVEIGRGNIPTRMQPDFYAVEAAQKELPAA